ncbi:hypothetical protein RHMOL_Rhmol12G0189600 [Rhododendron molle]|uniref:Uncharacterized protein n=1 Tax=Rhododendron molle TaxID=49168 RepID=A0ACC0LLC9_RHOML|nr:hypothetical protein RHMOL_Rhmol12G0189600 [Rhododendron molle]
MVWSVVAVVIGDVHRLVTRRWHLGQRLHRCTRRDYANRRWIDDGIAATAGGMIGGGRGDDRRREEGSAGTIVGISKRLRVDLDSSFSYPLSLLSSHLPDSLPLRASSNPNPSADYSFVASLEKFLAQKPRALLDDAVASASEQDVKKLDDMIWKTETKRLYGHPFLPPLRVYVYEMPKKFTYDLLTLFRNTYRETSNGSPVHRLIEQA